MAADLSDSLTLTSYNIHKGMSPLNQKAILQDLARALQNLPSDVFCLQEVQGWHQKRLLKHDDLPNSAQDEWLGGFLGFDSCYGKNSQYPQGHHGNAILSRFALQRQSNLDLSVNRFEQRGLLHCEIVWQGRSLVVLCTHLNLLEADRLKQYQKIADYVEQAIAPDMPIVLAGDFNDWHKTACGQFADRLGMQEVFLQSHGRLLPTFPARLPVLSLDRIYVRHLQVVRSWVHSGTPWSSLSDHLPISVELVF